MQKNSLSILQQQILPEGRRIVDQNHLKSIWQQQVTLWSHDDRSRIWLELYTSHFFPKFGQARLRSGDSKHVQKLHQGAVKKAEAVKGKRQKYKSAARPQSVALITDSGVKAVNQLPTKSMCKHLKGSLAKQLRIHLLPVILDIISLAYVYYCTVITSNYLDHQNVHKLVNSWFQVGSFNGPKFRPPNHHICRCNVISSAYKNQNMHSDF